MPRTNRRAFTLIELLVVLSIIAMILSLALPSILGILQTSRILAATDELRAAVSKTRSTAVASRHTCIIDMPMAEGAATTEMLTTSVIQTFDDFERYPVGTEDQDFEVLNRTWKIAPVRDSKDRLVWQIFGDQTRELCAGLGGGTTENAYAWHVRAKMVPAEPWIDVETAIQARFRVRRVVERQPEWGFGIVSNFSRTKRSCYGYRLAVRVRTDATGWNKWSKVKIEKIYNRSNPNDDNYFDATDPDRDDADLVAVRVLDDATILDSAIITTGVPYLVKMRVKRENKVVTVAGKVWVEGSPEPTIWTVGPVVDIGQTKDDQGDWTDAKPAAGATDNFREGGNPFSRGFAGVWTFGAETYIDDFLVDAPEIWILPKGIHMQPMGYDPGTGVFTRLNRYAPGGFPLLYRADGSATAEQTIYLLVTDTGSGDERWVQIDHNTGRVEPMDELPTQ